MEILKRLRKRIETRVLPELYEVKKFKDVNAIEYFHETHEAHVYVKGQRNVVSEVLKVLWTPSMFPEANQRLPVVWFRADTLSTEISFKPYVDVEYDPHSMELRIVFP